MVANLDHISKCTDNCSLTKTQMESAQTTGPRAKELRRDNIILVLQAQALLPTGSFLLEGT